jgi:hypothetical protein
MGVWEVLLPTASQNCAKTSHFFSLGAQVRSKIISTYIPLFLIFFNINTSYNRHSNAAKRKSMIVRFVQRHKKMSRMGDMIIRRSLLAEPSHYFAQGSTKEDSSIRRSDAGMTKSRDYAERGVLRYYAQRGTPICLRNMGVGESPVEKAGRLTEDSNVWRNHSICRNTQQKGPGSARTGC